VNFIQLNSTLLPIRKIKKTKKVAESKLIRKIQKTKQEEKSPERKKQKRKKE
jgi:hypothetical protein